MVAINHNQWNAYGVVMQEPQLRKLGNKKVMAFTILMTESAGAKSYLPIYAFNTKAHVLCSLAHRGSMIFAKGTFKTAVKTTSIQGKQLISLFLKITDFEVLLREPIKVADIDFADTVALYDPDNYMEEEDNGESKDSQEACTSKIEE